MAGEIINRVAQSKLITFDLEAYYPEGSRFAIDIKDWLYEGLILKEKDFRAAVAAHDWTQYQGAYVALFCSTEAIVPTWAYMLITTALHPYAKQVVLGEPEVLETLLYGEVLEGINWNEYRDKSVIIKGCSQKPVPPNAYIQATSHLLGVARKIFYGEACSSVPLYKRK